MRSYLAVAAAFAALTGSVVAQEEDPQQPTESPAAGLTLRTPKLLGCYTSPGDMWDMGPYTYQAMGWCQPLCVRQGVQYFGLVNGTNCFCGNSPPKDSEKVDDDDCNVSCNGIDKLNCGGSNKWQVYNDAYRNGDNTGSVKITTPTQTFFGHEATETSKSSSSKKSAATGDSDSDSDPTKDKSTVVVTISGKPVQTLASTDSPSAEPQSSGPNKAGIAAGVVVGVVALLAIVGGVIFFIRRKKQKDLDDERRRHEAMTNFVTRGEKAPSTFSGSDSRLEPSVMFQRRQSDGSIADNQDYSRRILKVTNPDDR